MSLQTRIEALAARVAQEIKSLRDSAVLRSGDQTVDGSKTFTSRLTSYAPVRGTDFELSNPAGAFAINAEWGGSSWVRINAGRALLFRDEGGTGNMTVLTAPTGAAGSEIAWTQRGGIGDSGVLDGYERVYSPSNPPPGLSQTELDDRYSRKNDAEIFFSTLPGANDDERLAAGLAAIAALTLKGVTIVLDENRDYTFAQQATVPSGFSIRGAFRPQDQARASRPIGNRILLRMTGGVKGWLKATAGVSTFGISVTNLSIDGDINSGLFEGNEVGGGVLWTSVFRDISIQNAAFVLGTPTNRLNVTACAVDGWWNINNVQERAFCLGGSDFYFQPSMMLLDSPPEMLPPTKYLGSFEFMSNMQLRNIYCTAEGHSAFYLNGGSGSHSNTISGCMIEGRNAGAPSPGALVRIAGGSYVLRDNRFAFAMTNPTATGRNDGGVIHVSGGTVTVDTAYYERATGVAETVPFIYATGGKVKVRNVIPVGTWTGKPVAFQTVPGLIDADDSVTVLTKASAEVVTSDATSGFANTGTSISINKPAGAVEGNLLVAAVGARASSAVYTTPPAGWAEVAPSADNTAAGVVRFYYKVATGSEPASYAWAGGSSGRHVGVMFRVTNFDASVLDGTGAVATLIGGPDRIILPSVTTTTPSTLLLGVGFSSTTGGTVATFSGGGMTAIKSASTNTGASESTLTVLYEKVGAAGATGTRSIAASATASTGSGYAIAIESNPAAVIATPSTLDAKYDAKYAAKVADNGVASNANGKVYKDVLNFKFDGGNPATNKLVIRTNIPFTNRMVRVKLQSYHASDNAAPGMDLDIWTYTYGGFDGLTPATPYASWSNNGPFPISSVEIHHDTAGKLVLVLTSAQDWQYPHVWIPWVMSSYGHVAAPDSYFAGWSAALTTDLSGLTLHGPITKVMHKHDAGDLTTGTLSDLRLPARLGTSSAVATGNWDNYLQTGGYQSTGTITNQPVAGSFAVRVDSQSPNYVTQTGWLISGSSATQPYRRHKDNGVWGDWYRVGDSQVEQDARYVVRNSPFAADADTAKTPGWYFVTETTINLPTEDTSGHVGWWGSLEVIPAAGNGSLLFQRYTRMPSGNPLVPVVWQRFWSGTVWTPWEAYEGRTKNDARYMAKDGTAGASLRAMHNMTGGGTITLDASFNLKWSARFIIIGNGTGAHFGTGGYFDITMPANGAVITGVGGAANQTVTADGIPLGDWQALYYILPINSGPPSIEANFRLVAYTGNFVVPDHWVLIAVRNNDNGEVRLGAGWTMYQGQSISSENPYPQYSLYNHTHDGSGFDPLKYKGAIFPPSSYAKGDLAGHAGKIYRAKQDAPANSHSTQAAPTLVWSGTTSEPVSSPEVGMNLPGNNLIQPGDVMFAFCTGVPASAAAPDSMPGWITLASAEEQMAGMTRYFVTWGRVATAAEGAGSSFQVPGADPGVRQDTHIRVFRNVTLSTSSRADAAPAADANYSLAAGGSTFPENHVEVTFAGAYLVGGGTGTPRTNSSVGRMTPLNGLEDSANNTWWSTSHYMLRAGGSTFSAGSFGAGESAWWGSNQVRAAYAAPLTIDPAYWEELPLFSQFGADARYLGSSDADVIKRRAAVIETDTRSQAITYNGDGTVAAVTEKAGSTTVKTTTYTYNGDGSVKTAAVTAGGVTVTTTYAYDGAGTCTGYTKAVV